MLQYRPEYPSLWCWSWIGLEKKGSIRKSSCQIKQGSSNKLSYDTKNSWLGKHSVRILGIVVNATADNYRSLKFSERKDAGTVIESLNSQINIPMALQTAPVEPRIKLKANTEIPKFSYKTMAMKLSEASEILDDRIEEFLSIVQGHHKLDNTAFGNPATQSQNEIIAVGRIASDSPEGKLNSSSIVLETSRRMGAGLRIPLKVEKLRDYEFFPGQIVALRGTNASGEFFQPTEVLNIPSLEKVASTIDTIDGINDRLTGPDGNNRSLVTIVASGPYTTDEDLDFSPFNALLAATEDIQADSLILCGPFLDAEHPLIRSGDFDLPENYPVEPDKATMTDLFRAFISHPLNKLAQALPSISIVLCPSTRDAISKHAAWPQDKFVRKELGLPRQVSPVPNPMKLSMNEIQFGISSLDILDQLRSSEVVSGKFRQINILDRLCRQIIEQRHFFPVFPPVIAQKRDESAEELPFTSIWPNLDVSYLKLGEMLGVLPDVLVTPSILPHFAKVRMKLIWKSHMLLN
jgi:DNA polymerase alpha subunit B